MWSFLNKPGCPFLAFVWVIAVALITMPAFAQSQSASTQSSQEEPSFETTELDQAETQPDSKISAEIDPVLHYKQALRLTKEKQYDEALTQLEKALEQNPNYWEAKYQTAFIHQITGKKQLAIKEYKQLLKVRPDDVQGHINLGTLLKAEHDHIGAESEYRQAIDCHFYSFAAHYDLANLLVEQGKLDNALKEYKVCLKLSPQDAMVHNNLGVIYQKRRYYEEAAEEFAKAAKIQPENKIFRANLKLVQQ